MKCRYCDHNATGIKSLRNHCQCRHPEEYKKLLHYLGNIKMTENAELNRICSDPSTLPIDVWIKH